MRQGPPRQDSEKSEGAEQNWRAGAKIGCGYVRREFES